MKQSIFIIVFLLLFFTGSISSVDARWVPEDATPEDVERLVRMEEADKARIIREQKFREKAEQEQKQASGVSDGIIEGRKEAGKGLSSQAQAPSSDKQQLGLSSQAPSTERTERSGKIQPQPVQGVSGVSTNEQGMPVAGKETGGLTEVRNVQKTGWKDWMAIGFFIIIFISSLALYLYAMNRSGSKITGQKQNAKNTGSKGLTLLEIMVATAVFAISVLCILKVFRYASLVQPQTGYSTKAMTLCEEKLEEIRNRPYGSLTTMIIPEQERITMGPYGWVGTSTTPRNGGATRTVTIKGIDEVLVDGSPIFEEVAIGNSDYLKATVKVEWGRISIRNSSGTITGSIPIKRELSTFIADRP